MHKETVWIRQDIHKNLDNRSDIEFNAYPILSDSLSSLNSLHKPKDKADCQIRNSFNYEDVR